MKRLNSNISLALTLMLSIMVTKQSKASDLIKDYQSQETATWETAQYQTITESMDGNRLIIRYYIDKNSNIYKFRRGENFKFGPTKIGSLKEKKYLQGNTCLLGTNYECLSNVTRTTYQFAIQGGSLYQYTRTDYIKSDVKGDVNKTLLGGPVFNYELSDSLYETAKKHDQAGKNEDTIKYATKSLNINPTSFDALILRAVAYQKLSKYAKALKDTTKAIELRPRDPLAYLNRCDSNLYLKNYNQAISDCNKGLSLNNGESELMTAYLKVNLARSKFELGDKKGGCENYNDALKTKLLPKYLSKSDYEKYILSNTNVKWCVENYEALN